MNIIRRDQFIGSNNIAKAERLPKGAVVEAVNVDFTVGGKAELRTGFELVREQEDTRAIFEMGADLALIAGDKLIRVTPQGDTELATLAQGPVAAVWHAGELFLNTVADSMRIGAEVRPWAVPAPAFDIVITTGSFPAGVYQVAVTAVDGSVESGCLPMIVTLGEGQAIRVNVDDDRDCRLYCSVANGSTLYHQGVAYSTNLLPRPVDDTARLVTAGLYSLPFCTYLVSHQALIVGAHGRYLYHSQPMWPHLTNPESDFVVFPAPITLLAAVEGGVFVCADHTYFVSGLGSAEIVQRTLLEFGAIEGSSVMLPDGSAAWFTQYGQVIGRKDGSIELLNQTTYSPDTAELGAAGYLEHNGNQMVVTSMRGQVDESHLRAGDFSELEVIDNG